MRKLAMTVAAVASVVLAIGALAEQPGKSAPAAGASKAPPAAPAAPVRTAPAAPANNPTPPADHAAQQKNAQEAAKSSERRAFESRQNRNNIVVVPWSNFYGWGYYSSPGWAQYPNTYGYDGYYGNDNASTYGRDTRLSVSDLPSNLNGPARAEAEAARSAMMEAASRHEKDFQASDAYVEAAKEQREAQAEYDAAVHKARAQLKQSGDYKDAVAEKREAQQQVEAAQAVHKIGPTTAPAGEYFPTPAVKAAQKKLDAATEVTQMERERLEQEPQVRKTRERLDAANAKMLQLRREFEASLANDPQWAAAKQRLDAAIGK